MYANKDVILQLIKDSSIQVDQQDINEILEQLEIANTGDVEAMVNIAKVYKKFKKYDGYLFWLQSASSKGYPDAQYILANCYIDGEIMEEDYVEAFKLYKKAAEAGHPDAANNLADMYMNGEGIEVNEKEA
ncbi:sel1 repeat family protein, partial [Butyricicoccus sp. 1XD8-22]